MKLVINTSRKYGTYLKEHLQQEHPKTKGRIQIK